MIIIFLKKDENLLPLWFASCHCLESCLLWLTNIPRFNLSFLNSCWWPIILAIS